MADIVILLPAYLLINVLTAGVRSVVLNIY